MLIYRLLRRSFRYFADRSRRRGSVDQLLALDPRLLRDIGLERSEILSVTCFPKS
jgi:uncharacterized protein YjiS (DUF1127 family)